MKHIELAIQPDPDFGRLETVLRRTGQPDRVPFYELFTNIVPDVLRLIGEIEQDEFDEIKGVKMWEMDSEYPARYMLALGYDYLLMRPKGFVFPQADRIVGQTKEGERGYIQAGTHIIADRGDFERYAWPDPSAADYSQLEDGGRIPKGMKLIVGSTGILENVMWLLGYEGVGYLLYDNEQLVAEMFDAVGARIVEFLGTCASHPTVGALQMGEDMGFNTQTLLSPEVYRKYLFPWHRKVVEAVHSHGKPIILHSCGNLSAIMEDIIDCGWDARHSFEDSIEPVWEAKQRWGDRIAILGGFDMDKITNMSVPEVQEHTRMLISRCAPGGGWTLGTGNSVADYIPAENYLAMLEEGFRAGTYA